MNHNLSNTESNTGEENQQGVEKDFFNGVVHYRLIKYKKENIMLKHIKRKQERSIIKRTCLFSSASRESILLEKSPSAISPRETSTFCPPFFSSSIAFSRIIFIVEYLSWWSIMFVLIWFRSIIEKYKRIINGTDTVKPAQTINRFFFMDSNIPHFRECASQH